MGAGGGGEAFNAVSGTWQTLSKAGFSFLLSANHGLRLSLEVAGEVSFSENLEAWKLKVIHKLVYKTVWAC